MWGASNLSFITHRGGEIFVCPHIHLQIWRQLYITDIFQGQVWNSRWRWFGCWGKNCWEKIHLMQCLPCPDYYAIKIEIQMKISSVGQSINICPAQITLLCKYKSEIRISINVFPAQIEGEAVTVVLGSVGKSGERKVISHTSFTFERNQKYVSSPSMFLDVQVTRVLRGGEVEARVISGRQLFISVTNSTTNCSFLVNTSAHHGDFVRSSRRKQKLIWFWFSSKVEHPVYQTLAFSPKGDFLAYTAETLSERDDDDYYGRLS